MFQIFCRLTSARQAFRSLLNCSFSSVTSTLSWSVVVLNSLDRSVYAASQRSLVSRLDWSATNTSRPAASSRKYPCTGVVHPAGT